ncbi:MAG: hypothetical protein QM689_10295 [Oscillospiraceae bacterium]
MKVMKLISVTAAVLVLFSGCKNIIAGDLSGDAENSELQAGERTDSTQVPTKWYSKTASIDKPDGWVYYMYLQWTRHFAA